MTLLDPNIPWLTLLLLLPLAGALLCVLAAHAPQAARRIALVTTLLVFAVSLQLFVNADPASGRWFAFEDAAWIERFGIRYTLGLDGLNLLMILLTGFLQVVAVLISWPVQRHVPFFFALLLVMETGVLGVFLALDLVLFYLFWEVMLVPMFLLIYIWGHHNRNAAALKFLLFTLAGSLLMLVGLLALHSLHLEQTGVATFALEALRATRYEGDTGLWLFAAFAVAFLIKVPVVPLHTWLPDAHTEAPTAGSVDLAGLLLKTGAYAMLRFGLYLFPEQAQQSLPLLATLALVGLFHAAWAAYVQRDIKRLIAYSSVAHLGLVVLGFAAWDAVALQGSLLLMLAHGITTGGLFALVAMLEARTGTRDLEVLGGLWGCAPKLSAAILLFSLSSLGLPGLANFSGEILILLGVFRAEPLWGALAMGGVVFAAAYMLRLLRGVIWGPTGQQVYCGDLTGREYAIVLPMAALLFWIGLYPQTFLAPLQPAVAALLGGAP